jgi:hypothetical protein
MGVAPTGTREASKAMLISTVNTVDRRVFIVLLLAREDRRPCLKWTGGATYSNSS